MEEYKAAGKLRSIGVFNMTPNLWKKFVPQFATKLSVNQVECNPFFQRDTDIECAKHFGVQVEAWDPFAEGWESNESVDALKALCEDRPLEIQMSMYGGFEQFGLIGQSLQGNDVQTTTQSGDIVLYSGNQIVVFYGSHSWAYTRPGRITGQTAEDMERLPGNGDVTITFSGRGVE
ncbi:MAG: cyclophilin-like fold protein [Acetatifactor muris]|nr:cyclophilin-like fold protein [Acetatifactor muris]